MSLSIERRPGTDDGRAALRAAYAEVFGEAARSRHRHYLIRRIAWRLQADAEGGLSERALRRAEELANIADVRVTPPNVGPAERMAPTVASVRVVADPRLPAPGRYHLPSTGPDAHRDGACRRVRVRRRALHPSLTAVAKAITGSHINGFPVLPDRGQRVNRRRSPIRTSAATPTTRCVYTRKSSDEGLQQEFNSLDAQREAAGPTSPARRPRAGSVCQTGTTTAASRAGTSTDRQPTATRRHRSGQDRLRGRLQGRPAQPIAHGLRQDRGGLRALQRLVRLGHAALQHDELDGPADPEHSAVVRPVRARSSANASATRSRRRAQKGKWTGGTPILEYDVDRSNGSPKLVVNAAEASRVRQIFDLYIDLETLLPVVAELERAVGAQGVDDAGRPADAAAYPSTSAGYTAC